MLPIPSTDVDRQWMRAQRLDFIDLVNRYERVRPPGDYIGDQKLYDELHRAEPAVRKILHALDPRVAEAVNIDQVTGPAMARDEAHRGLGLLDGLDEWDRRLAPDAQVLAADPE